MSLTEQDLRDLLAERAAGAPAAPGRAAAVERRGRRARRRDALLALGAVVVVAAAALPIARHLTADPTQQPMVTPTPTPTVTHTASPKTSRSLVPFTHSDDVAGIRINSTGPSVIPGAGSTPFTVVLTLTNASASTWHGTVGVGLSGALVNYFGDPSGTQLLYPADAHSAIFSPSSTDLAWFSLGTPALRIEGLSDPAPRVIAPGQTVTVTIRMIKQAYGFPHTEIRGWLPVLNAGQPGVQPLYPAPGTYPVISFG